MSNLSSKSLKPPYVFYFEKQVFFKLLCSIPTKTWCKCSCCRKTLMFITKKRPFTSQWYVVIQKRSICLTRDKKMRHRECRGGLSHCKAFKLLMISVSCGAVVWALSLPCILFCCTGMTEPWCSCAAA